MTERRCDACVIGASAGGVAATIELLSGLKPGFPLPLMVVLHTAAQEDALSQVLGMRSHLPVEVPQPSQPITGGRVWVAPAGYHLLIEKDLRFSLSVDDKVCFVRPSATVLFESAADVWRERLAGVILTGGNDDGADGLGAIRSRGGVGIVQDPAEAEAPAMPRAALERAGADHVLPLKGIAPLLNRLAGL